MDKFITRGATPTHRFNLLNDVGVINQIAKWSIVYVQQGNIVMRKTEEHVTLSGQELWFKLTQDETLAFRANRDVEIQLKALTESDDVLISKIFRMDVKRVLDEEVMV